MTTTTTPVTAQEPRARGRRRRARPSEGAREERRLGWLLCAPAVIVMLAVTAYPIGYAIYLSLQRYILSAPQLNKFVGFSNYGAVLTSPFWWHALWVTVVITVVSVAIELVLGMLLALVMYRTIFGRGLVRTTALIPYGIVTIVAAFSWQYAWTPSTGYLSALFNNSAPLTKTGTAVAIIILAEVWKTTAFMALLLMKPAILVALLFRTLDAFRIFDNIFILTGGTNGTGSVSILNDDNLFTGFNFGIGSAMSILIMICVAIIAIIFIKGFGTAAPGTDISR